MIKACRLILNVSFASSPVLGLVLQVRLLAHPVVEHLRARAEGFHRSASRALVRILWIHVIAPALRALVRLARPETLLRLVVHLRLFLLGRGVQRALHVRLARGHGAVLFQRHRGSKPGHRLVVHVHVRRAHRLLSLQLLPLGDARGLGLGVGGVARALGGSPSLGLPSLSLFLRDDLRRSHLQAATLRTLGFSGVVVVVRRVRIAAVVGIGRVVGCVAASLLLGGALLLLALALPLLLLALPPLLLRLLGGFPLLPLGLPATFLRVVRPGAFPGS
mmetsp:Transcript_4809/g.18017  ORF Transcript_4809/g.18017 Transcript_4809/m.18017 type:complete len:276 (+) Transcript_4809:36-863(+)